jgi:type II secretory pathway component PulJ
MKQTCRARTGVGRDCRGYLLLEVLLALGVLSLAVVMIFQIIQTTLKVTADIDYLQVEQRKVDGLFQLMRRNFCSMPATAVFLTREVNGLTQLIFHYTPFNFTWVNGGAIYGTVVIAPRPQADGNLALSILQEPGDQPDTSNANIEESKSGWFPLLTGIESMKWRFFSEQTGKWVTTWQDTGTKPTLVEMTFKLAGRNHIDICVFRWPVTQSAP